jgi:hypothetical protein
MKTKRTYRLSQEAVATVKRLAEQNGVAPTQDAVVELAIQELARQVEDEHDARRWIQASSDPAFQQEAADLAALFREDDHRAWER